MDANPYESPKELSEPIRRPGSVRGNTFDGVVIIVSLAAWYVTGLLGELSAHVFGYQSHDTGREAGWTLGIPVMLAVVALAFVLTRRRENRQIQDE